MGPVAKGQKMNQAKLTWTTPPDKPVLASDEVHVWLADLEHPVPQLKTLRDTLSSGELERADRFHFQRDREQFIAARGLLRAILSRYLDRGPDELTFSYGPNGKPALTSESDEGELCFNLSRRQGLALYAVTRGQKIGVDLELIREDLACEQIAERFFSPRENAALQATPMQMRQEAFFTLWTCKESYIKATGTGLSLPLDQFNVLPIATLATKPEVFLSIEKDPEEAARWSLRMLPAAPRYAAALAVEGHLGQLKGWQWRNDTGRPREHRQEFSALDQKPAVHQRRETRVHGDRRIEALGERIQK